MTINRETLSLIIDVFEDFLDEKGVAIDNPEKTEPENNAQIYGSDFDQLMNKLQSLFAASGIHIPDVYDNEITSPEPKENLIIYIPAYDDIISINEGTGDNLLKEDEEEGYVDYLNYYVFDAEDIDYEAQSTDGGMLMSTEYIREKYNSLKDAVPEVLEMLYGTPGITPEITWVEISGGADFEK